MGYTWAISMTMEMRGKVDSRSVVQNFMYERIDERRVALYAGYRLHHTVYGSRYPEYVQ
jgi:hypothetical protein